MSFMTQRNIRSRYALEKENSVLGSELPGSTVEGRIKPTTFNIGEKIGCARYHQVWKKGSKPL